MITNICLLLEELSVLLCIHYLYGEKFKLDIKTTSYLAVYMIIMSAINYYDLPRTCTFVTYPLIFLYCGFKFGWKWERIIINNVLFLVLIGGIQLLVALSIGIILHIFDFQNVELLVINIGVFLIVLFILPRFKVNRLSEYLQHKERILIVSLLLCVFLTLSSVISYKIINIGEFHQYIPVFIGVFLIFMLGAELGKYKLKSKEMETELRMNQIYGDSFKNLIDEIRLRQHEFENHISTIYSLHYTHYTYDELVRAQEEYSKVVIQENRFNKLIKVGNPMIIGFLYGKFIEIDKKEVDLSYKIDIQEFDLGIPVYKIVEILGNLMKNAVEALLCSEMYRSLYVSIIETDGEFEIEVRNRSEFIDYSLIEAFFKKGFSQKGEKRGLGLYNVKKICNEYSLQILCENKNINEVNWLSFTINNSKETI